MERGSYVEYRRGKVEIVDYVWYVMDDAWDCGTSVTVSYGVTVGHEL